MEDKFKIDEFNLQELEPSFANLPEDPYTEGGFRFRRFTNLGVIHYTDDDSSLLFENRSKTFIQSAEINGFLGDVERTYEKLEDTTIGHPRFKQMIMKFQQITGYYGDLGVHQIRIVANDSKTVLPAPEGKHQDGFKFVGAFTSSAHNVSGGLGQVFSLDGELICEKNLSHKYLILKDEEVLHNATPVNQIDTNRPATWDTFVLTST